MATTSAAVGYARLTETERIVYAAERELACGKLRSRFPELGDDIKVMGIRRDRRLELIVAAPLLDRDIRSAPYYHACKAAIAGALEESLNARLQRLGRVQVRMNALDANDGDADSVYLTVKGLSAQGADSGAVGRGNRVNGLIPLLRPRGAEAAAGKNPYSHVGKIYSALSQKLAEEVLDSMQEIAEATVWLCSRIGAPISEPAQILIGLCTADGVIAPEIAQRIEQLITTRLENIASFCDELAAGVYPVC